MRRRIAAVAALLAALTLAPGCPPKAPANASDMNLPVITLDMPRAGAIGLYGNTHAVSPRIDELGRTGLVFEACCTPAPLTLPAHCSLFTGRYPVAQLDPGLFDAYINITVALRGQGRYAEALKYLETCKERLYPRLPASDRE
ncbi:MAG: hypothetical protein ACXW3H_08705, partial [Candidatus Aminicenantales bacterium]